MKERNEVQALVTYGKKVLLVRKDGYWRLPKGGIKDEETSMQALRRELFEEVDLQDWKSSKLLHRYTYTSSGVKHNVQVFSVRALSESVKPDGVEITVTRWVAFDEAKNLLEFDEEKQCVERI